MRTLKTKYGCFSPIQMKEYKKKLHNQIHWFLIYYENKFQQLDEYFAETQYYLNGLDEVLNYPVEMIELMTKIECARIEYNSESCNFNKYRKSILDAHTLVDLLPEYTEGGDTDGKSI